MLRKTQYELKDGAASRGKGIGNRESVTGTCSVPVMMVKNFYASLEKPSNENAKKA